jgi:NADH pyrophosphatase NudC (nudix superfamily)
VESVSKYINADDIPWRTAEEEDYFGMSYMGKKLVMKVYKDAIDKMPAADVAPVKCGEWEDVFSDTLVMCSRCANLQDQRTNYCSECGAKMESEASGNA